MSGARILFVLIALAGVAGRAHDRPHTVIQALTHRLEAEGPTARTLTARGFEYQAMRQGEAARADFAAALAIQPDYLPALLGATEASLRSGRLGEAAAMARQGLHVAGGPEREAPFHAWLARIYAEAGDDRRALAAWRDALRSPRVEIEWLIGEADCLGRLGRADEKCEALAAARQRNPSVVLHHAWIRALIEAGRLDTAQREVQAQLERVRWRGSWLVLSARIAEARGDRDRQRTDADAAWTELRARLGPASPDPQLAADLAAAADLRARAQPGPGATAAPD